MFDLRRLRRNRRLIRIEKAGIVEDAASAGFYPSATGRKYPRVQLLMIEGLMTGTQRAEHPDAAPATFKQAKKEARGEQRELL